MENGIGFLLGGVGVNIHLKYSGNNNARLSPIATLYKHTHFVYIPTKMYTNYMVCFHGLLLEKSNHDQPKECAMKIRCNDPECRTVVNLLEGFIRVDNRVFCSVACSNNYLRQVQRFDYTTRTLEQSNPLNYKSTKWWER